MFFTGGKVRTVRDAGADAGSELCGQAANNKGLRLRILERQDGGDGPVRGAFIVLDVGSNRHADSLRHLLGRSTDAAEVLALIRADSPCCVNVVNTGILATTRRNPGVVSDPDWPAPQTPPRPGVVSNPDF